MSFTIYSPSLKGSKPLPKTPRAKHEPKASVEETLIEVNESPPDSKLNNQKILQPIIDKGDIIPEMPELQININEKANLIWAIADKLTGSYKPHEYGEVILPLTVIRRFDCILEKTKEAVVQKNKELNIAVKDPLLRKVSGHSFYNVSPFTFPKLLDDPDNIEANFRSYLNGFSENVRNIIERFKFDNQINYMAEKNLLYIVLKEFTDPKADLHPDKISNLEMGYIFEEIIRRFSEAHNEDAGQHYTPREVIELMVNILFAEDSGLLSGAVAKTLYDPACGTGGMLTVAEEHLLRYNSDAKLICFGQEINAQTYAICKSDILIKGANADYIKEGNTLSDDLFQDDKFDYILSNPPFGREWKNEKDAVEKEQKRGFAGRFGPGIPAIGDSQMLFLLTTISKMKDAKDGGSRVAIIHNGSPLFSGDAGSGPSEIRKYIIENDLLEAIIALPNDIFYNTGIATYIWVLSNKKAPYRKGKVQLINANEMYEKRRKALGNKRNDIPKHYIDDITKVYGDFRESEISKIFYNEEFGYSKIVVERPLLDDKGRPILKKGEKQPDNSLRDTENVPLTEDIESYFAREVLPFISDVWIDSNKTKIGYEIPFTKYFYKFIPPEKSSYIIKRISNIEDNTLQMLRMLFRGSADE
jgi:type I restriction enzyme M protein